MKLVLGVSGSISAYKAVEILRLFQKNNHQVSVAMTRCAQYFLTPLSFETFAPGRVFTDLFAAGQDPVAHIHLSRDNDLLLIAPATANIIGKMANGIGDDLLSTLYLAFYKQVIVAPAMNYHMLDNPAVVENIAKLKSRKVLFVEPEYGKLACEEENRGRLASIEKIYQVCVEAVGV